MKLTLEIRNKTKLALTLLVFCIVIFLSNYRLKQISSQVNESIVSIYEDRLLVQDFIYSYHALLNKFSQKYNTERLLDEAIEIRLNYLKSKLTKEEEKLFHDISTQLETSLKENDTISDSKIYKLKSILNRLEQIQLEEAKKQMALIERAHSSQELVYYLETAILIVLLIIALILIKAEDVTGKLLRKASYAN